MNREPNHTCKACGVRYWACNDCDAKEFKSWRAIACCPEHYQAYLVLWEYDGKKIDKECAASYLKELGAEEWVNAPSKNLIDEILAENEKNDVPTTKRRTRKQTETEK